MPISVLDPVKGAVPYTEENSWYLRANNIPSIFAGSSVEWRDESNTVKMEYGEPFEEGKTYWCRVFVYESEQAVLAPNVDFYINGEKAIERTEQGGRCFERKFVIGSAGSLIGKVTSFGLETDDCCSGKCRKLFYSRDFFRYIYHEGVEGKSCYDRNYCRGRR